MVVNRYAGEAVLRGAQVYSPGLLAASRGLAAGDLVGVSVACEMPGSRWCGIARGAVVGPTSRATPSPLWGAGEVLSLAPEGADGKGGGGEDHSAARTRRRAPLGPPPPRSHLFLGVGRCVEGRRGMFRNQSGLAVEMVQRVYESPSINGDSGLGIASLPLSVISP